MSMQKNAMPHWLLILHVTSLVTSQYIPVREEFAISFSTKKVTLKSDVGFFSFLISGDVIDDFKDAKLNFQFNTVDAYLFGRRFWGKESNSKPKTYTFFHVDSQIAAARSSAGGFSLLLRNS